MSELEFQKWIDQCIKDGKEKLGLAPVEVAMVLLRALNKELLEIYFYPNGKSD